jgi:hypothetical protein
MRGFAEKGYFLVMWFAFISGFCWLNYQFPHFTKHTGIGFGSANDPYFSGKCKCTKSEIDIRKKRYKVATQVTGGITLVLLMIYIVSVIYAYFTR